MTKFDKRSQRIRKNPHNIKFQDFVAWLEDNGFTLDRVRGSHHILSIQLLKPQLTYRKRKMEQQKHIK